MGIKSNRLVVVTLMVGLAGSLTAGDNKHHTDHGKRDLDREYKEKARDAERERLRRLEEFKYSDQYRRWRWEGTK